MSKRLVPERAKRLVKNWEGCKLRAYKDDAGVWTIGYGWTLGVRPGMVWTQKQAEENFEMHIQELCDQITPLLRPDTTDDQLSSFLSFAWNVGFPGFRKSDARAAHNAYKPEGVLKSFMSWTTITKPDGTRVRNYPGLVRRRTADWKMYSRGEVTSP